LPSLTKRIAVAYPVPLPPPMTMVTLPYILTVFVNKP
jgi:hypothetical protein